MSEADIQIKLKNLPDLKSAAEKDHGSFLNAQKNLVKNRYRQLSVVKLMRSYADTVMPLYRPERRLHLGRLLNRLWLVMLTVRVMVRNRAKKPLKRKN